MAGPSGLKQSKAASDEGRAASNAAIDMTASRLGQPSLKALSEPAAWLPPAPGSFAIAAPPLSACVPLPLPGTNDSYTIAAANNLVDSQTASGAGQPGVAISNSESVPLLTVAATDVFGLLRGMETVLQMAAVESSMVWIRRPTTNETGHAVPGSGRGQEVSAPAPTLRNWQRMPMASQEADRWAGTEGDVYAAMAPLVLPSGRIHVRDSPFLGWRGMLLDTARHFAPMKAVARAIQGLSWTKANVLHWHPVDAQAFSLQLPGAVRWPDPGNSEGIVRPLADLS